MTEAELLLTILGSIGGSGLIAAGLAAWLGKVWADRISQSTRLFAEIDIDLRKRRIEAYLPLWRLTSLLSRWPRSDGLTYEDLYQLSRDIRAWYYEVGGIFLSRSTHLEAYGPLQDEIARLYVAGLKGLLSDSDYDKVRERCSLLRSGLVDDVQSRRQGPG